MVTKYETMSFLRRNREDRGVMAALRCLLKEEQRFRGWQCVAQFGGIGVIPAETVSGLYALHPLEKCDLNYNFGDACRLLSATRRTSTDSMDSPFDRRFRRLLSCSTRDELRVHLTDIVRGMKAAGVPINYESLFDDVSRWGDVTREKWAIHYWGDRKEDEEYVSD